MCALLWKIPMHSGSFHNDAIYMLSYIYNERCPVPLTNMGLWLISHNAMRSQLTSHSSTVNDLDLVTLSSQYGSFDENELSYSNEKDDKSKQDSQSDT